MRFCTRRSRLARFWPAKSNPRPRFRYSMRVPRPSDGREDILNQANQVTVTEYGPRTETLIGHVGPTLQLPARDGVGCHESRAHSAESVADPWAEREYRE